MVLPYNKEHSKKNEVRAMFDNIALRYDFLNHFLSLGIDVLWRKKLIKSLMIQEPDNVLDMATGTGDLAIMAAQAGVKSVSGIDLSPNMVQLGNEKIKQRKLDDKVRLHVGDAEAIRYDANHFDAAMVAFGVRNFEDLEKGLSELHRVIKPGKALFILEFSKPRSFLVKQLYYFYSFKLLPFMGRLISKDNRAYSYLPESIRAFPAGNDFIDVLKKCNFAHCRHKSLSFGIVALYTAYKPLN